MAKDLGKPVHELKQSLTERELQAEIRRIIEYPSDIGKLVHFAELMVRLLNVIVASGWVIGKPMYENDLIYPWKDR